MKAREICAVCIAAVLFCSMDWPSREGTVIRNFGWNNGGRPVLGSVYETAEPVLAAEAGEIIFSRAEEDSVSRLPSPLGAWAAVDHGDGLISVYSRYEDGPASGGPFRVDRGSPLARPGISGWSGKQGFYFGLFDRRERRWVNPSMIITPLPDTRPPSLVSVRLKNAEGRIIDPAQNPYLSQGRYTISVAAIDTRLGSAESPLAPHRIVCSVNGAETGSLGFETIPARDGVLMVYRNGLVPAKQVYASFPAFEIGEASLTRGQAILEIIVQDITGNARRAVFRLFVD